MRLHKIRQIGEPFMKRKRNGPDPTHAESPSRALAGPRSRSRSASATATASGAVIAARAIASRGCAERVAVAAGDMLDGPLPGHADVHLYSNVLHDWDEPVVRQLIAASFAALPAGGLIVIHDAFLNAAKDGPLHVAEYSVHRRESSSR